MTDLTVDADSVQATLLGAMSLQERFLRTIKLCEGTKNAAMKALAARWPELTPSEIKFKFIEVHYGADLAAQFKSYLKGVTT